MYIREMLQELNPYILEGSGEPDPEKAVVQLEFYRYARGVRPTHIYLAEASELEALSFPAREEPLVLLVSCADGAVPDFPFPQGYVPVYLHRSTGDVVKTITDSIKLGAVRLQIQGVFELGRKAHMAITGLLSAACRSLNIGVYVLYKDDSLLMADCSAALCSAYCLNPENRESFFEAMGPSISQALECRGDRFYKGGFCYEVRRTTLNYKMNMTLVVFYDENAAFDMNLFARLVFDQANRQSQILNGSLEEDGSENSLSRILDGTIRDYLAIADILYGADQAQKGYRLIQIRPSDGNAAWRQWAASIRTVLNSAFCRVHILEDGETVTAIPIAQYGKFNRVTDTKNSQVPIRYYCSGWDMEKLREQMLLAGADCMISQVTSGVDVIVNLHVQTRLTLDIARKVERDGASGHIWNHMDFLPYLPIHYGLQLYRSQNPSAKAAGLWMHPDVFRLIRNDVLEKRDLTWVLYTYLLSGADVSAVAHKLFMHRNTVYNRLKDIEAFTGRSLKDGIFYRSFLPSLRLYYYCRDYLNMQQKDLLLLGKLDSFTDDTTGSQAKCGEDNC